MKIVRYNNKRCKCYEKRPSDNSYVKRIGLTGSNESNAWRNEDMKQGLYRANGELYKEVVEGVIENDCNYNPENTLQDLNYLNKNRVISILTP